MVLVVEGEKTLAAFDLSKLSDRFRRLEVLSVSPPVAVCGRGIEFIVVDERGKSGAMGCTVVGDDGNEGPIKSISFLKTVEVFGETGAVLVVTKGVGGDERAPGKTGELS